MPEQKPNLEKPTLPPRHRKAIARALALKNPRYLQLYKLNKDHSFPNLFSPIDEEKKCRISILRIKELLNIRSDIVNSKVNVLVKRLCDNISDYSDIQLSVIVEFEASPGRGRPAVFGYTFLSVDQV